MPEIPNNKGAFLSFLDWLDRPGQVVRNVIKGNYEGAARQAGDFALDAGDAAIPFWDAFPQLSRERDDISGSDFVGLDKDANKLLRMTADVGIGTATDPLTYIGLGPLIQGARKGAQIAAKGIKQLPRGEEALGVADEAVKVAGRGVRSVFGAERVVPHLRKAVAASVPMRGLESAAGIRASEAALSGLDERQLAIVGDVMDNFRWQDGKLVGQLIDEVPDVVGNRVPNSLAERVARHPDLLPGEAERLVSAAEQLQAIGRTQKGRAGVFSKDSQANLSDEYLMRQYSGMKEPMKLDSALGAPKAIDGRSLKSWRDVASFLESSPGVAYERSALKRSMGRAEQQGILAQRGDLGAQLQKLAREGQIQVPDELIRDAAGRVPTGAAPVPRGVEPPSLDALLGGARAGSLLDDLSMVNRPMAKAPVSEQADIGAMMGGNTGLRGMPETSLLGDAYKGGKSVVPEGGPGVRDFTPDQLAKGRDQLLSKEFAYADGESRKLAKGIIDEIEKTDPESAQFLRNAFDGLAPRGAITEFLAKTNRLFKPAAVFGVGIPKFGSIVRNKVSGVWSALSNPETRGAALGQAKRLESDLRGAVVDSLGLTIGKDQFGHTLDAWESALKASAGSADEAIAILAKTHPEAAQLIKAGALDGFVSSEQMITEMGRTGWKKKFFNVYDWPARIFRGVEDRMRLGLGLDLLKAGKSAEEAARLSSDALFNYAVSSQGNRTARDIIPFFQFMAKAIPQQAKFMAEVPAIPIGLAQLMGNEDSPLYPHMLGKLNIPIGEDEDGNPQYISGIGLPFETLNSVPNFSDGLLDFGRSVEQNVVGAMSPLLKTAYSVVSGREPFFGSGYGSYSKLPGNIEAGGAGQLYNMASGTGLIQPVASLAQIMGKAVDDRMNPGERALDFFTGVKISSVDPDRAIQQRLTKALERNPDIQRVNSMYSRSGDPATMELIQAMRQAQAKVKAKREAEQAKADVR